MRCVTRSASWQALLLHGTNRQPAQQRALPPHRGADQPRAGFGRGPPLDLNNMRGPPPGMLPPGMLPPGMMRPRCEAVARLPAASTT